MNIFKDFQFDSPLQKAVTGAAGCIYLASGAFAIYVKLYFGIVLMALGFCMIHALRRPVKDKERRNLTFKKKEKT